MSEFVSIDAFAARRQISTRTVRRWLDDERIPGAVKLAGKWSLPADAVVQDAAPAAGAGHVVSTDMAMTSDMARTIRAAAAGATVAGILAPLPVMLPLDVASRVLGVSEYTMRRNADYFELVRMGERGAYVMPKARVRELNGAE